MTGPYNEGCDTDRAAGRRTDRSVHNAHARPPPPRERSGPRVVSPGRAWGAECGARTCAKNCNFNFSIFVFFYRVLPSCRCARPSSAAPPRAPSHAFASQLRRPNRVCTHDASRRACATSRSHIALSYPIISDTHALLWARAVLFSCAISLKSTSPSRLLMPSPPRHPRLRRPRTDPIISLTRPPSGRRSALIIERRRARSSSLPPPAPPLPLVVVVLVVLLLLLLLARRRGPPRRAVIGWRRSVDCSAPPPRRRPRAGSPPPAPPRATLGSPRRAPPSAPRRSRFGRRRSARSPGRA